MTSARTIRMLFLLAGVLTASVSFGFAGEKKISIQGQLTDPAGAPRTGTQVLTFRLYTSSASPVSGAIWTETMSVPLQSGTFNVNLGNFNSLDGLTFDRAYYLGMQVSGDAAELMPRQMLGASTYALGSLGDFNIGGTLSAPTISSVSSATISNLSVLGALNTELSRYRRPILQYDSATTVTVESGLDGTPGDVVVLFPDGKLTTVNSAAQTRFDITRPCALSGVKQSGLRASLAEAPNTWYALYFVRAADNDNTAVTVGDTTLPIPANFAALNAQYGKNKWVYLGLIRNGDNAGVTSDILRFVMSGNFTTFQNATNSTASTFPGVGTRLSSTAGALTLTYTYAAGTGATNIPDNVGNAVFQSAFGPITNKVMSNSANTATYFISGSGGANAVGQYQLVSAASSGLLLWNGPGASIPYTIQLMGFFDTALGVGSNPLM